MRKKSAQDKEIWEGAGLSQKRGEKATQQQNSIEFNPRTGTRTVKNVRCQLTDCVRCCNRGASAQAGTKEGQCAKSITLGPADVERPPEEG